MAYIEFADADAARDGLRAAVDFLMLQDGYSRWQIEDLVSDAILDCLGDEST